MNYSQKIRKLYNLSEDENFGFSDADISKLEERLGINLPATLKEYYLTLGKNDAINQSHNRILNPKDEIDFSNDRYLVFYEENQVVAFWGIKEEDLKSDNPAVWGNYGTNEEPDWYVEADTTENFFLLMAVYNGTLGGLEYNANYFGEVSPQTLKFIQENWTLVPEISYDKQKVYTDEFNEVLSLSFDDEDNCVAIFIGTSDEERFDKMLDNIDVDWSYTSYENEEWDEED